MHDNSCREADVLEACVFFAAVNIYCVPSPDSFLL